MSTSRFARRDSRSLTQQKKLGVGQRFKLFLKGRYRWGKNRKTRGSADGTFWSRLFAGLKNSKTEDSNTPGLSLQQRVLQRLPQMTILVFAITLPILVAMGYRYLTHTPSLGLREVQVEGNVRVTPSEVMAAGGLAHGPNLLALDLDEVEAGLISHPWVRSAKLERILPDRLRVVVSERRPAVVLSMGAMYLVDQQGFLFDRLESGVDPDLPMVTGIVRAQLLGENGLEQAERMQRFLRQAIVLSDQWSSSELGKSVQLREIQVDPLLGYSIVLGEGAELGTGAIARLGHRPLVEQFDKLSVVLSDTNRRQRAMAEIHLDDERDSNRIAVRFRAESEAEQGLIEEEETKKKDGASYGQAETASAIIAQSNNTGERD